MRLSVFQHVFLHDALERVQPSRREARTVRILKHRGMLKDVGRGFVETTDRGREAIGMEPRTTKRPRLRLVKGGRR